MSVWKYIGIVGILWAIIEGLGLSEVPSLNPEFRIEDVPILSFSAPSSVTQKPYFMLEPAD